MKEPDTVPSVYRGSREQFKRDTAHFGTPLLKEHTGFLASRSLTLPAAPPDEPQALFDDFLCNKKKKCEAYPLSLSEYFWEGVVVVEQ